MNFCKMNGAGNDFIIIDNREAGMNESELSALAAHLCERRMSIGADGLIAVETARGSGDFRMRFFNADGSRAEMCGNGARCICRYGYENGLAGAVQRVETDAGIVVGKKISGREYRVLMNRPSVMELDKEITVWDVQSGCNRVYRCDYVELGEPGVPHAVLEYNGLSRIVTYAGAHTADQKEVDSETNGGLVFRPENDEGILQLREIGRAVRKSPCFPKGANVNFYEFMDDGRVLEMTFERGVEDFTYACGSGSASVAAVLAVRGRIGVCGSEDAEMEKDIALSPRGEAYAIRLLMRGGELGVRIELADEAEVQDAKAAVIKNAEMKKCEGTGAGKWQRAEVRSAQATAHVCAALIERVYLSGPTNMVACGVITDDELQNFMNKR